MFVRIVKRILEFKMEKDNKLKSKNVQTYTEDMVKAIESDKGGLIKKIIHEEEEHEAEKKNLSPRSKRNKLFMSISIILVFFALVVLVFLEFFRENINIVSVAPQFVPIIFNDQTVFKAVDELSKDEITQTILNEVNSTEVKIGGVEGIYLTENKKVVGFRKFIALLKSNLVLDQADFVSDAFLIGTVNKETKDFFILFQARSFTDVFPIMRVWESKMLSDLHGFFGVGISSETNYLFTEDFENGIVENKNARILYDHDGEIVLMYIFADDNSIIVANSEPAAREVILRLASSHIK
ncbi:MAG: hypothetical protein UT09_C0016G0008 [Parcubacteria group bacterium GW2011_GWF2_38_8]|nr:MAG: hypothetical protein UT09_C0016G0008 [Parcubacteria group bacterium GW2011_GWF2_38_8]